MENCSIPIMIIISDFPWATIRERYQLKRGFWLFLCSFSFKFFADKIISLKGPLAYKKSSQSLLKKDERGNR